MRRASSPKSGASSAPGKFGKGKCAESNKDNLSIEHFSFKEDDNRSTEKRARALRKSFGIPRNINGVNDIKTRVNEVMSEVCVGLRPMYITGAINWAIDRNDAFQFDHLTSVKLDDEFVGFMTVKDSGIECDVTLICAQEGCGGYVYDQAEAYAQRRSIEKVTLQSVMAKYGFYRKKGFSSKTKLLDDLFDRISNSPGIPGDDNSEDFLITHFWEDRKSSKVWSKIKSLKGATERNSAIWHLIRNVSKVKLVNLVVAEHKGGAEAFFDQFPQYDRSASGTISMEKILQ